ncbi:MAG: S8 family serine peptidase, partial [Chitinispirillaceae bacterium]|nr:S8 family serine peptidase [Chitinispirillaceae bacterium]
MSRYGGKTKELAIARIPFKGIRAYQGRRLALVTFSNSRGRDGVLEIINELKKDENVAYVEPDYIVKAIGIPNDPLFERQYALHNVGQTGGKEDADIDAPEAWDIFTGASSDVILGIIDTGVDYLNEDLAANMWKNPAEIPDNGVDDDNNGYVDDVYGYDFAYDDNDPMDVYGHGTHCAGIAAAVGDNSIGISGVSWGAKILAAKFLSDDGWGNTSDAIDAIAYATAMGATITSNSWGGGGYSQALYEVIAQSGLFVAAAGNSGINADVYPMYPAAYDLDNIISVAATDHNDELAYFSNYGAISVDLGAPGVDVLSCLPGGSYEAWSGTSMATPHVAGCAVLLRTYNPVFSDLEIKEAILNNTDKLSSLDGKTVSGGRLNVRKVLETSTPWIKVNPIEVGQVAVGEEKSFTVTVDPKGLLAGTWVAEVRFIT